MCGLFGFSDLQHSLTEKQASALANSLARASAVRGQDGTIAQQTEKLVGPYELHDFYLYYVLRFGFGPAKIYHLARTSFAGKYEPEVLLAWLKNFYRRFFAQQFKRSCLPDGPKVGSVTLSPRGDWRMPSDACNALWMAELEKITL